MAAVSSRLQRGLGLDIALGAAHGVLVDRLDGGLGRVILLVVTYMKETMSILATVLLKHRLPEGPALVWIPIPLDMNFFFKSQLNTFIVMIMHSGGGGVDAHTEEGEKVLEG